MATQFRLILLSGAAALFATTGLAVATPASAQAATPDAVIRAAHLSPTTPGVDVYLTPFAGAASTHPWLSNVGYGQVSNYQALTPGLYTVAMRPQGASPKTPAMLTWTLNAHSGAAYTVAGVGAGANVRGVVIPDSLTAPPSGQGRVRVIQASSRAPVASLSSTTGAVIAQRAPFASVSDYATLPAGVWDVRAVSAAAPSLSTVAPVDVRSGQITSILLLDGKSSGITLRTLVDSAGAAVTPVDAVPAGAGGMATTVINRPATDHGALIGLALAGLAGVGGLAWRRRTSMRGRHACP